MATDDADSARRRRSRQGPDWLTARSVHLVSLMLSAAVMATQLPGQWFWWDEFAYLGESRVSYSFVENLLRPHNEHWVLANGLLYGAPKPLLGLQHYALYLLPVVILHVVNMHLVWRIMNRTGLNAWVATALASVYGVVGAGYENVVWAFQIAFVGSTALGLGAVLLCLRPERFSARRGTATSALLLGAMACSGVGLVYAGLAAGLLLPRSVRLVVRVVAVPLALYACGP